jgi:hypothetical protein
LAHGTVPADKETVNNLLAMYEKLLKEVIDPETFDRLSKDSVFITM